MQHVDVGPSEDVPSVVPPMMLLIFHVVVGCCCCFSASALYEVRKITEKHSQHQHRPQARDGAGRQNTYRMVMLARSAFC